MRVCEFPVVCRHKILSSKVHMQSKDCTGLFAMLRECFRYKEYVSLADSKGIFEIILPKGHCICFIDGQFFKNLELCLVDTPQAISTINSSHRSFFSMQLQVGSQTHWQIFGTKEQNVADFV